MFKNKKRGFNNSRLLQRHSFCNIGNLTLQVSKSQDKPSSGKQMSLGVAVSTMVNPDAVIDDELKTVFDWCKDGNTKHVARLLTDNSINIDEKDSEVVL